MSYAIAGTDILQVVTGCELSDIADIAVDDSAAAQRLAARLLPFLLGGLRAPLPQF
jgi:hypothetical protein